MFLPINPHRLTLQFLILLFIYRNFQYSLIVPRDPVSGLVRCSWYVRQPGTRPSLWSTRTRYTYICQIRSVLRIRFFRSKQPTLIRLQKPTAMCESTSQAAPGAEAEYNEESTWPSPASASPRRTRPHRWSTTSGGSCATSRSPPAPAS